MDDERLLEVGLVVIGPEERRAPVVHPVEVQVVEDDPAALADDPGARYYPLPPGTAVLTDISMPGNGKGWAIGYLVKTNGARHFPFVLKWNGKRWKREALPGVGGSSIPQSLDAKANGDDPKPPQPVHSEILR